MSIHDRYAKYIQERIQIKEQIREIQKQRLPLSKRLRTVSQYIATLKCDARKEGIEL